MKKLIAFVLFITAGFGLVTAPASACCLCHHCCKLRCRSTCTVTITYTQYNAFSAFCPSGVKTNCRGCGGMGCGAMGCGQQPSVFNQQCGAPMDCGQGSCGSMGCGAAPAGPGCDACVGGQLPPMAAPMAQAPGAVMAPMAPMPPAFSAPLPTPGKPVPVSAAPVSQNYNEPMPVSGIQPAAYYPGMNAAQQPAGSSNAFSPPVGR